LNYDSEIDLIYAAYSENDYDDGSFDDEARMNVKIAINITLLLFLVFSHLNPN
jgi:hypothetical protein